HSPLPSLPSYQFLCLFDLESRFFAPTHTCWRLARTGAVKVGRRSGPAARSVVSRPALTAPRHAGCGRDDTSEGSLLSGHEELAPQPCIRWVAVTPTMMHACASAAKLRGGGPILKAGIAAMGETGVLLLLEVHPPTSDARHLVAPEHRVD